MALNLSDKIADKLRSLVIPSALELGSKHATVLAIASNKGGVGKTTTAVNVAVAAAARGLSILLIDLDPQAHVSASLRSSPKAGSQHLTDVLLGRLRDVKQVVYPSRWPGLDLAGSDKTLGETEMILSAKIGKELILHDALRACRTHYDLIILDCPPNLGTLTLNALCAADKLLVPSDMSVLALEGVGDILAAVETVRTRLHRPIEVLGILATRLDKRATQMNHTIAQSFYDLYGRRPLQASIPQSTAINQAHMAGESIFDYAPKSPGAEAYAQLTLDLIEILEITPFANATPKLDASVS